jgi:hypothetical protein
MAAPWPRPVDIENELGTPKLHIALISDGGGARVLCQGVGYAPASLQKHTQQSIS